MGPRVALGDDASEHRRHMRAMRTSLRATSVLLNVGHAFDHMFLLVFATAVATIAADFGFARWEDLMPMASARSPCSGCVRCRRDASATCGAGDE